jgi:tetratricopeptide (TPR) repeat protein
VPERVAAGDMLFRTKDYEHAIDVLNQVVELFRQGKATERPYADAAFLLAESYFASAQLLSARRYFNDIVDRAPRAAFMPYAGRSLSRLVDIALRADRLDMLDEVFEKMARLPPSDASGSLQYARAKAYFTKGDFDSARASAGSVPAGSDYAIQTHYLLGVMLTKQAMTAAAAVPLDERDVAAARASRQSYLNATEQFRRVTRMQARTAAHRHVVDLAWMAIGRLFYESDNYLDAAEAYSHVDRASPEFSTMLYELAWVYVRLGDFNRAQRALEVLTITDPQRLRLADGSLLRADLMLRSGQYEQALVAYEGIRKEFDPVREQVDAFLRNVTDPAVYYDRLTQEEWVSGDDLSPIVLEWAREEAEDDRVFSVIDDVTRSRDLIKRSRGLVAKLSAVLASPARAKAFPELKASLEQTVGLINKLGLARLTLAQGMDDVGEDAPGGEIGQLRGERHRLEKRLGWLPVTEGDFALRDASGERQWNGVSQNLQRLTLEADRLQAIVNGLRRLLREAEQHGVTADAATRERFRAEIEANERDLEIYRRRISEYREAIELGRVQIGFGDQRYVDDDQVRERFKFVFQREVELAAAGHDNASAAEFARDIQGLLARANGAEARLSALRRQMEERSQRDAIELQGLVDREAQNLELYVERLDTLDQQARLLVGEVAMRNFALVRDRLKGIVLRADVGIVQQAWELREEQRDRVRDLQRERAREESILNDELQEVLDDAEDVR